MKWTNERSNELGESSPTTRYGAATVTARDVDPGNGSITSLSRCFSSFSTSGLPATWPRLTIKSIQEASSWSPQIMADESNWCVLPAPIGSFGRRCRGVFGLGGGCGFNRRRGQNSMVMGGYSKEQPTRSKSCLAGAGRSDKASERWSGEETRRACQSNSQ